MKALDRIIYIVPVRDWDAPGGFRNMEMPARFLYYTKRNRVTIMVDGYRRLRSVRPTSIRAADPTDVSRD